MNLRHVVRYKGALFDWRCTAEPSSLDHIKTLSMGRSSSRRIILFRRVVRPAPCSSKREMVQRRMVTGALRVLPMTKEQCTLPCSTANRNIRYTAA